MAKQADTLPEIHGYTTNGEWNILHCVNGSHEIYRGQEFLGRQPDKDMALAWAISQGAPGEGWNTWAVRTDSGVDHG